MRRAEERRSASMMISSSIRWSFAGNDVDWTMKTSCAADVLLDLDEDLHVGEAPDLALGQRHLEIGRDRLGQRPVGIARDELDRSLHGVRSGVLQAKGRHRD